MKDDDIELDGMEDNQPSTSYTCQQETGGKKDHQDETENLNTYARNVAYNEEDEHVYEPIRNVPRQSNTNNEEAKSLNSFQYDDVANLKQDMEKNKKLNLNIKDDNGYIGVLP
jgi:hypothetical protein